MFEQNEPQKGEKKVVGESSQQFKDVDDFLKEADFHLQSIENEKGEFLSGMLKQLYLLRDKTGVNESFLGSKLSSLEQQLVQKIEKTNNNQIWQEFFKKNGPFAYEAEEYKYSFSFKSHDMESVCDNSDRIMFIEDKKAHISIYFNPAVSPEQIEDLLNNVQGIPDIILKKLKIKIPAETVFEGIGSTRFKFKAKTKDGIKDYLIISSKSMDAILEMQDDGKKLVNFDQDTWYEMQNLDEEDSFKLIGHQYKKEPVKDQKKLPILGINDNQQNAINSSLKPLASDVQLDKPNNNPSLKYSNEVGSELLFRNGLYSTFVAKSDVESWYLEKPYLEPKTKHLKFPVEVKQTVEYLPNGDFITTLENKFPKEFDNIRDRTLIAKKVKYYSKNGNTWERDYNPNGELVFLSEYGPNPETETVTTFDSKGKPVYKVIVKGKDKQTFTRTLIDQAGNELGTFPKEMAKNLKMTSADYIKKLAEILDTPEKWHHFIHNSFEYTLDTPDFNKPFIEGKEESLADYLSHPVAAVTRDRYNSAGEYDQTPIETLLRTNQENEKMKGDCDDYAFLFKAILEKQGIKANIVLFTAHVACVYIKKRPDGRYDSYLLDTGGIAKNGEYININGTGTKFDNNNGFATEAEAMNSIYVMEGEKNPEYLLHNGNIAIIEQSKTHAEKLRYYKHNMQEIVNE